MATKEILQIRVDNRQVGVIGLTDIMTALEREYADRPDDEIMQALLQRVERDNYIPDRARAAYGHALVREFRRHCGQAVEEEAIPGLRVLILDPGCARCDQLERDVREVMAELKLAGELLHVSDVRTIARYGLLRAPALIINDAVVAVGSVPHRTKIRQWLAAAASGVRPEL